MRTQYGDKVFSEQHDLEAGVAIVEEVLPLAREAIAQDVGGEAALAPAAEPYERAATAPWLMKYRRYDRYNRDDPGEEIIGVWKQGIGVRPATADEIERGIYYPDHAAYVAAQNGDLSRVPPEKQDGSATAGVDAGAA